MAVVSAISVFARAEAAATAHRLAAIHALMELRLTPDDQRNYQPCDLWDATVAEVGAAMGISRRKASGQMCFARAMHTRLPRVFALLQAGSVSARTASTISFRTRDVLEDAVIATIDRVIAAQAASWGGLSDARLDAAIDHVLAEYDPLALATFEEAARRRDVEFGKQDDATGTCSMWGRIYSTDAALLRKRLAELTRQLCADDPRSAGERRADALGALAADAGPLTCRCGRPECVGTQVRPERSPVVIHVVADEAAVAAARRRGPQTAAPTAIAGPTATTAPSADAAPPAAPSAPVRRPAAVLEEGRAIPNRLLRELLLGGAKVTPLKTPSAEPEPHYRPSAALAAFVRSRDMWCRFPGCTTPAQACDIDHWVPYPAGPTHPSDLRCLCRKNHLLKTFYVGEGGWSDVQHPDGRIEWTSPTGHTYTTYPGSRLFFPSWDTTTAPLPNLAPSSTPSLDKGVQMPRRRRTREEDRLQRIKSRRAKRDTS
ncbi:HNH endonuclease signature motif containing protein [Mycobacterium sp. ACS4331]|uniref:HNH endonuclease signature motif containing protein n=1 Tax=Mycobacterium sp. ACS4331 TaxID=1834121 RepID=UPI000A58CF8A|nr:HNH endonuclease signature motif containing protein [Mycobacterium sp. ACS4331]